MRSIFILALAASILAVPVPELTSYELKAFTNAFYMHLVANVHQAKGNINLQDSKQEVCKEFRAITGKSQQDCDQLELAMRAQFNIPLDATELPQAEVDKILKFDVGTKTASLPPKKN
jgi:hypothetical protein